jgi:hypothetical protein
MAQMLSGFGLGITVNMTELLPAAASDFTKA